MCNSLLRFSCENFHLFGISHLISPQYTDNCNLYSLYNHNMWKNIITLAVVTVLLGYSIYALCEQNLNKRQKCMLFILLGISIISTILIICNIFFNSKYFKTKINDQIMTETAANRMSISLEMYSNVEHADIYRVVSDETLMKMYPGIIIKEPSMHNLDKSHNNDDFHQFNQPKPKNSSSIWSNLVCNSLVYSLQIQNICISKISQKNKFRSNKKENREISSMNERNTNNNNARKSKRKLPPPPPRKPKRKLPPPPPRKMEKRNVSIPPPPPPPIDVMNTKPSVTDSNANKMISNEAESKLDCMPAKKKMPSLSMALMKDIHKGKTLTKTAKDRNENDRKIKIGPMIKRDPKTSNIRHSLLKQIEAGKVLRKSSVQINSNDVADSPWDSFAKQLTSRRRFFTENDTPRRSSLSATSNLSSRWLD